MKSLLVPIDFTPLSLNAVHAAASIASRTEAKIFLLHNVLSFHPWETANEMTDSAKKTAEAENKLREIQNSGELRPLNCEIIVTHGVSHEEIITKAYNLRVELIVMGSHGNTPAGKHFVDSNVQKVLREAICPVILIDENVTHYSWQRMLVPASFNEKIDREFERIFALAEQLRSTIHLVYINRPDKFKDTPVIVEQINRFISRMPKGVTVESGIYDHHDLEKAILEYAQERKCDSIAMVTHDHRHQAKYLISTTETIACRSMVPVISVPIRKQQPAMA